MYSMTLEINQICNLRCKYCYLGRKSGKIMGLETAKLAIDLAFKNTRIHRDQKLWIDFIGGEPLISFDVIKKLVDYIENRNTQYQYNVIYSLTTNAVLLSEEILNYFALKKFNIKISLDGEKATNDKNRISLDGLSVHDRVMRNMDLLHAYELKTKKFVQVTNVVTKNNFRAYYDTLVYLTQYAGFKVIDSSIDLTAAWTKEELQEFESILQRAIEYFIEKAAENNGFHWGFARMMLKFQSRKKRFYTCGGGIISAYVRTDGSIFACPGNLNQEMSIGNVKQGFDTEKCNYLRTLSGINNKKCKNCEIYETCTANSCVMYNMLMTGDADMPAPLLCYLQQLFYRLFVNNKTDLLKIQM